VRAERDRGEHRHQRDPRLGRPEPPIAEPEHAERLRLQVRVDREREIRDDQHQRDREVHVRGQPEAEPDERRRQRVGEVVEVVAVARPLGAPHARQGAVERVAQPLDDEQRRHPPQPPERAERREARGGDERQGGQVIGQHARGQTARDRLEQALLGAREEEGLLTWSGGIHD